MNYPLWYVPLLGAPMLIPVVALIHVVVSHFAVGGGILIWVGVREAQHRGDEEFLHFLRNFVRFFLYVTVVFGAITGVGIWWTIGLSSPETTSALIHTFVFGWATEWVTFVVELVSVMGLYYFWDRMKPGEREGVAFLYALSAWLSLVIITGVTAFMASPGHWVQTRNFWDGFLNPTFLPGVLVRTGGSLMITTLWAVFYLSWAGTEEDRNRILQWFSRWAALGALLVLVGGYAWTRAVPVYIQERLAERPTVFLVSVLLVGITFLLALGLWMSRTLREAATVPAVALTLLLVGFAGQMAGEFVRESFRKPYTIAHVLYSTSVYASDLAAWQEEGSLQRGRWIRWAAECVTGGNIENLEDADPEVRAAVGEILFTYHCSVCHTRRGYLAILPRIRELDREDIADVAANPPDYHPAMPPFAGTEEEAGLIADYLVKLGGNR